MTPNKFQKKAIIIEAMQLTEESVLNVIKWVYGDNYNIKIEDVIENGLNITTLEDGYDGRAKHVANIGDYIIKGVKGEFYPCKADIFKITYEAV